MNIVELRSITEEFEKQAAGSYWKYLMGEPLQAIKREGRVVGSFYEPALRDLTNAQKEIQQRVFMEGPKRLGAIPFTARHHDLRMLRKLQKEQRGIEMAKQISMSDIERKQSDIARRVALTRLGTGVGVGGAAVGLPLLFRQQQQPNRNVSLLGLNT